MNAMVLLQQAHQAGSRYVHSYGVLRPFPASLTRVGVLRSDIRVNASVLSERVRGEAEWLRKHITSAETI